MTIFISPTEKYYCFESPVPGLSRKEAGTRLGLRKYCYITTSDQLVISVVVVVILDNFPRSLQTGNIYCYHE